MVDDGYQLLLMVDDDDDDDGGRADRACSSVCSHCSLHWTRCVGMNPLPL